MKKALLCCLAATLAALPTPAAHADPVTFTLTGTFTGTLGALSFTDAAGTITETTDTTATSTPGGGFYTNTGGISTITLDGIGTAIFLSSSFGAIGSQSTAGFYDTATSFGASIYDPVLGDYALTVPFSDTATLIIAIPFGASTYPSETTSIGELTLTGDNGTMATFTAAPEPSTWALLALGIAGAGFRGLRRRRSLGR